MTDDEILATWERAVPLGFVRAVERRSVEREACAKVCDSLAMQMTRLQLGKAEAGYISWISWNQFGEAIRTRSEVKP